LDHAPTLGETDSKLNLHESGGRGNAYGENSRWVAKVKTK